jgi:hypothetical protein
LTERRVFALPRSISDADDTGLNAAPSPSAAGAWTGPDFQSREMKASRSFFRRRPAIMLMTSPAP